MYMFKHVQYSLVFFDMYKVRVFFLQIHEQNQWNFVNIQKTLYFHNHLQQKVLDGFQCFFIPCKAEIVSSHEHLESFNSTDSSLRNGELIKFVNKKHKKPMFHIY